MRSSADQLIQAAQVLRRATQRLQFGQPVTHVYNPLLYAWSLHAEYLSRYGNSSKPILFVGMNPGPFGMAQTGVPFGEVAAVRDWLQLKGLVGKPQNEHPKRPIQGFDCPRSEVSGRRLWGLFARRFGTAQKFFAEHFVVNYCPLLFVEASGCNRTPDKLPGAELEPLLACCDEHLRRTIEALRPRAVVGIGRFAEQRARAAVTDNHIQVGSILHPSPASPASNRDWEGTVTREMQALKLWPTEL